jgi:hypothetical protein
MNYLSALTIIKFPPDSVRFSHLILDFQLLKIIVSRIVSTESEFGGFLQCFCYCTYLTEVSFVAPPGLGPRGCGLGGREEARREGGGRV